MTVTVLAPYLKQRWVDGNGNALYQGTINTYAAGTLTPIATYKDSTGGTQNTNPIVLNARGECDLYLLSNVAYKFIVADVNGNLIPGGTIDNVVNSQLITLYGGVDVGSVNAYVLTFTANFTAYADGIYIVWIPANTNTGASTINVNGLGVVNIVNYDGSALVNGEITANQPAAILFKAGQFQLISATATSYGTFACAWTGFSAAPANTTVTYRKNGTQITLIFPSTLGTSGGGSGTTFIMTGLPALLTPNVFSSMSVPCFGLQDNSAPIPGGFAQILSGSHSIQFFKDGAQTAWTAAGTKGFTVQSSITYTT